MKIILIGAGQIGSRHLQGIGNLNIANVKIDVVDLCPKSIAVAKERYAETKKNNQTINYFHSIAESKIIKYDMAIIATNANVRGKAIKELLFLKEVKFLLLEKVLFQKESEYFEIGNLLQEKGVTTWVNHPRRTYPFYKLLQKYLENASKINFSVSVGNWGLACNALHLFDLFEFLSRKSLTHINFSKVDKEITLARRAGCLEINGFLTGTLGNSSFQINHSKNNAPFQLLISSDVCNVCADEVNGTNVISWYKNDWKLECYHGKITFFQSELTKYLIEDINLKGSCELPTYKDSSELHLKFINPLQEFINNYSGKKYDLCPIT